LRGAAGEQQIPRFARNDKLLKIRFKQQLAAVCWFGSQTRDGGFVFLEKLVSRDTKAGHGIFTGIRRWVGNDCGAGALPGGPGGRND
jgi:hypothetical protein